MRRALAIFVAAAAIAGGVARADEAREKPRVRLDLWRKILGARVDNEGQVAYGKLAAFDRERLETFVASLAHADVDRLDGAEAAALWINAYNAGVLWGVLRGGRPETLRGRARLYAWLELDVGGKLRTLDGIQAELARYAAADPRIHLALCNGARGAPVLARQPYDAESLDDQLERAAREFVTDPERNRAGGARPAVSRVFGWHRNDFTRQSGALGAWIARYLDGDDRERPDRGAPAFLDFDWTLNAAPGEDPAKEPPPPKASTARR